MFSEVLILAICRSGAQSTGSRMSDGGDSEVLNFYRGSTVLITGASGFFGQVLLEKILRSLEVRKVYVMVRPRRNSNVEKRLQQIFDSQLFDSLRMDVVKWRSMVRRVVPVEIDLETDSFAMPDRLKSKLFEEVNVVFNMLASVRFNDPLDCMLRTNVEYTDHMLKLVGEMKNLKSIVHVSSLYSNCDKQFIEERIYDDFNFGGIDNLISVVSKLKKEDVKLLTPYLIGSFPNTYVFSKKCAELLIQEKYSSLPIGIFRPPIVSSTYREPVPGWIDNFNGPSGMVLPLSIGLYSGVLMDTRKHPFIVPVDYCVNAMICCAMDVYLQRTQNVEIPVYNYADSKCNLSWGNTIDRFIKGLPTFKRFMAAHFTLTLTRSRARYALCKTLMQLEAYLLGWRRKTSQAGLILKRFVIQGQALTFFTLGEWQMSNENVLRMLAKTNEIERQLFPFDLTNLDWSEYFRQFIPGVVRYAVEPRKARAKAANERF